MEIVEKAEYDVLVELTPLMIFSGQPAITHIEKALQRGAHVISANKGPIAWDYHRLHQLAKDQNRLFYFETAVMDGTPIFNLVEDTLKFCKVTEVHGILNSTTNYVLEELAKGEDYDNVIAEGKRRGFIEADPAMDIEGYDAAAKTTALLNVLMDAKITPFDIDRKGIEDIRVEDLKKAEEKGKTIKLMCSGKIEDGKVKGTVRPEEIGKDTLLANIDGTSSAVSITTDLMGTVSIIEHAPEIEQTAYGIFSDLVRVLENRPESCNE
jgi:homoserine dehydrogenase